MKGFIFDLQRFAEYTFTYDKDAADGKSYILNGTGHTTPQEAFATLSDGDKVILQNDVDASDKSVIIGGNSVVQTITLDLNGHSWKRTAPMVNKLGIVTSGGNAFSISKGTHFVVEDNSTSRKGEIAIDAAVTAAFDGSKSLSSRVINISSGGSFTLNSGKIVNYGENPASDKVKVYGITGTSLDESTSININGGSIEIPKKVGKNGAAIYCTRGTPSATITIKEGASISSTGYGIDTSLNVVVDGGTIEGTSAAMNVTVTTSSFPRGCW